MLYSSIAAKSISCFPSKECLQIGGENMIFKKINRLMENAIVEIYWTYEMTQMTLRVQLYIISTVIALIF